jgi:hypothetical protein
LFRLCRLYILGNHFHSGYMSLEYAMEGAFSVKSYSFGVLLLEIVSGFKISSPHLIRDSPNLIVHVGIGRCSKSNTTATH